MTNARFVRRRRPFTLAPRLSALALVTSALHRIRQRFRCELGSVAPLFPPAPTPLLRNRVVFLANIPTEATTSPCQQPTNEILIQPLDFAESLGLDGGAASRPHRVKSTSPLYREVGRHNTLTAVTIARIAALHRLPVAPSPSRPRPFRFTNHAFVTSYIRWTEPHQRRLPSAARRAALRSSFALLSAALRPPLHFPRTPTHRPKRLRFHLIPPLILAWPIFAAGNMKHQPSISQTR